MKDMILKSNIHDYMVSFKKDFGFLEDFYKLDKKVFVIDKNVYNLYKKYFKKINKDELYIFNAIEENKTLKSVESIYEFLAKKNAKKNLTLISIGGGITQDVTGFVASTLYRGIKWYFLPTTFLAQADSCIGSKTSLNFKSYKNIIGGFYPPHKIFLQTDFLDTLTKKDFYSGIGEVVKFALLEESYPKKYDKIIDMVENVKKDKNKLQAIQKTMKVKKKYIDEDEFDTGKRNLFNYGHCFGHALESASDYKVPHGIAVTIGMIYANIVALNRKLISQDIYDFLNKKLFLPNIQMKLKRKYFDYEKLIESMKNDKKRVGKDLTIVIPYDDEMRAKKVDNFTLREFEYCYKKILKESKCLN